MVSPTQPLFRRIRKLALTTKMVNGGYYKGNRTGSMGRHTSHNRYIIEWRKVRTYVVPSLEGFPLTPFVTAKVNPPRGKFGKGKDSAVSGRRYLETWKKENGVD
ncbi:MAG: hypothetical protein M1814_004252 [Vezdaea aestivalis]|nr:MAG: hypothetical protein M1814_004252 [Vezdaea aestivalis]